MARVINEQDYAARRREILDAAQRLVFSKGYEPMTIQDILDALGMSKGAFYHYFDSKAAVLEALIARLRDDAMGALKPLLDDPGLPALDKIRRFFAESGRWKTVRRDALLPLLRTLYSDNNFVLRQKLSARTAADSAILLGDVIRQGIREGTLNTPFPEQAGEIAMNVLVDLSEMLAAEVLKPNLTRADIPLIEARVAAYTDALERVLGAPAGSLPIIEPATLRAWLNPVPARVRRPKPPNEVNS
ncbi:MAG: TetR/AcrR family transcriptional regulator [Thermoflexales bacterium]